MINFKQLQYFLLVLLTVSVSKNYAQLKIGDPGITFDNSKNDPDYPFMEEWQKAGVENGIPARNTLTIKRELNSTDSDGIQNAINNLNTNGEISVILLKNGTYSIDKTVNIVYSEISIF